MRNCVGKQAQQLTWFELSYSDMPSSPFMSASDTNSPSTHMSVSDTFSRIRFWLRLIINSWQGQRGIGLVWSRLTSVTFFLTIWNPNKRSLLYPLLENSSNNSFLPSSVFHRWPSWWKHWPIPHSRGPNGNNALARTRAASWIYVRCLGNLNLGRRRQHWLQHL